MKNELSGKICTVTRNVIFILPPALFFLFLLVLYGPVLIPFEFSDAFYALQVVLTRILFRLLQFGFLLSLPLTLPLNIFLIVKKMKRILSIFFIPLSLLYFCIGIYLSVFSMMLS